MSFFSPRLPRHYSLSDSVRSEIAALSADLDLELVAKSRTPIYGPLDCIQVERSLAPGFGLCFRFKLDKPRQAAELDKARALCASLCERNHKRYTKYVRESDSNYPRIPGLRY